MNIVARSFSTPFVIMCTPALLATLAVTPASAGEDDIVDQAGVKELHDALQDARDHGDPIDGDISEEALIKEIESQESGLKVQGGDGCSTPKASKALTKKYDNIFLSVCNKHDACYAPYSNTNRKDCDNQFGKDMNTICMKTPIGEQSQCLRMATIYKAGARAGGKSSYKGKGKNN